MPRIVSEYKEQARTKIIEQSLKVFADLGYYRTTMADIANAVGVSKAALYRYFDSKDELFIEAMKYHMRARSAAVQAFMNVGSFKGITGSEFFDKMLKMSMSQLALGIDFLRETQRNRALKRSLVEISEDWGHVLVDWIDEMKEKGEIRTDIDSSSVARGVIALRDGLYIHLMMGAEVEDVRKTWTDMTSLLMSVSPR
jgi:AcrR family transcriptional regulator